MPSPEPLAIIEAEVIRTLVGAGCIVIAGGGGGIPVVRRNGELTGVEAVIDKDLASALLATLVGAQILIISTDSDYVYTGYGQPGQQAIHVAEAAELRRAYEAGEFPPGSMGPKVLAALRFLEHGGSEVIITAPEQLLEAVLGHAGTHIVPDGCAVLAR